VSDKGLPEEYQAQVKALRDALTPALAEMIEDKLAKAAEKPKGSPVAAPSYPAKPKAVKGARAARCLTYLYQSGNNVERAISMAEDSGDSEFAATWGASVEMQSHRAKAMSMESLTAGGALLPPEFAMEIIEELGAKAVVMSMGVTTLPMNGSLTLPYIDTASSAAYVGEAANATESSPTTGQLQLQDKTLIALSALSNQLLRNGGPRVEKAITDQLIRVLKRKMDVTLLRSVGSSNEPTGMLYLVDSSNKFDATSSVTVAGVTTNLGQCVYKLMNNDVDLDIAPGWIFSPRSYQYLTTARDANSNLVWGGEMAAGTLYGFPFKVTSQIPENLGGGTESEVYLAAFNELVLGESEQMEVAIFPDGSYYNGSSVVSGISTYQTPIRIVARHDFACQRRGKAISVMEAVKWGA